jgi:hypothetical protein
MPGSRAPLAWRWRLVVAMERLALPEVIDAGDTSSLAQRGAVTSRNTPAPRISREVCAEENGLYGSCLPLPRDPHECSTATRGVLPCMPPVLKGASEDHTEIPGLRAIVIDGQAIHVPH